MGRRPAATEESRSVRLVCDLFSGRRAAHRRVNRPNRSLPGAARPPSCQQRSAWRIEFRLQKQLGERGVSLVGPAGIQAHLCVARHLEVVTALAVIDQRDHTQLGIGVGHDADGTASLHVAIASMELGAAGADVEVGWVARVDQRLRADRPGAVVAKVADVDELAPTIARGVFAPPGDIEVAPGAGAGTGTRDQHAVRGVGQQRHRRVRSHFAKRVSGIPDCRTCRAHA